MAFPDDALDVAVELHYDGQWNDITTDVRVEDIITITEGRGDEASAADPSTMSLTLDNTDGKYSPRNPLSPLYGLIGRNTPIRVRVGDLDPGDALVMPGNLGSYLSAPHQSGDDITGDIDIRLEVVFAEWPPQAPEFSEIGLARRYLLQEDNRAWALWMTSGEDGTDDGSLRIRWSPDGTDGAAITTMSTAAISPTVGTPIALRVTLDVDDDAGNHVVTFYTSDAIDGSWVQLGAAVTTAGTTSIFASDTDLEIGRTAGAPGDGGVSTDPFYGRQRAVEVRDGIDGAVVNSADLTILELGTRTFTSSEGTVWRVRGGAHLSDASILFSGEVSAWPARWGVSGTDVHVPIQAAGIGRRLRQGAKPLRSILARGTARLPAVVGYWPMEEGSSQFAAIPEFAHDPQISFGSAVGAAPATFTGDVDPGSYSGYGAATQSIPEFGDAGRLDCILPLYEAADSQLITALVHVPDDGVAEETRLLAVVTSGTVRRWEVMLSAVGSMRVRAFDDEENLVEDHGFIAFDMNGDNTMVILHLLQDGADIIYDLLKYNLATLTFAGGGLDTVTGQTYGRVLEVHTTDAAGDLAGTAVGHVTVFNDATFRGPDPRQQRNYLTGGTGETCADRASRLADEEDVPLVLDLAGPDLTQAMGGQRIATLLDLLAETAEADLGVIGDARDQLAVVWRGRHSLYNQTPALTLDYSAGDVSPPLEPEEDDQHVRNDVEVERTGGSSFRATQATGTLSILAPPDGVGRYDEGVELSLGDDDQLEQQARWRLHLGTVDELRYPSVTVEVAAAPHLMDEVNAAKVGDRITITNLPDWLPPGDVDLLIHHIERRLHPHTYTVKFACGPYSPWLVAEVGPDDPDAAAADATSRADTDGSQLASMISDSATSVAVENPGGTIWNDSSDHLPYDVEVGGEVMRVIAVAPVSMSTDQTLTVTRSINGVTKPHAAGTAVRLAHPAVVAL